MGEEERARGEARGLEGRGTKGSLAGTEGGRRGGGSGGQGVRERRAMR